MKARKYIIIHILRVDGFILDGQPLCGWDQGFFFPSFIPYFFLLPSPIPLFPKHIFRIFRVPSLGQFAKLSVCQMANFLNPLFLLLIWVSLIGFYFIFIWENSFFLRNILICLSSTFLLLELETDSREKGDWGNRGESEEVNIFEYAEFLGRHVALVYSYARKECLCKNSPKSRCIQVYVPVSVLERH